MLKIRFVDDYPEWTGCKYKRDVKLDGKNVSITSRGYYIASHEVIFIIRTLPLKEQLLTFTHEIGHWILDKLFARQRVQFWYDYLWHWSNPLSVRYYRELAKRQKKYLSKPLPRLNRRSLQW